MRDVIVAANWKMHTTPADAGELARTSTPGPRARASSGSSAAVRLPRGRARRARGGGSDVAVGAQNVHHELAGAYTGEISAPDADGLATWVIVGHSERRRDAGETDELIGRKLAPALDAGSGRSCASASSSRNARPAQRVDVVDDQLRGALAAGRRAPARAGW
jgi:triosephosphate isomerase